MGLSYLCYLHAGTRGRGNHGANNVVIIVLHTLVRGNARIARQQ